MLGGLQPGVGSSCIVRFGPIARRVRKKVGDSAGMVRSVRAFRILPEGLVHPVAYAVPFVEIALGVLLLLGLAVRICASLSALMLAAYIAAIASAAARGLRIECGCFSSGGDLTKGAPTHYTSELIRDSLLLVASGLLVMASAALLSLMVLIMHNYRLRARDDLALEREKQRVAGQ